MAKYEEICWLQARSGDSSKEYGSKEVHRPQIRYGPNNPCNRPIFVVITVVHVGASGEKRESRAAADHS